MAISPGAARAEEMSRVRESVADSFSASELAPSGDFSSELFTGVGGCVGPGVGMGSGGLENTRPWYTA